MLGLLLLYFIGKSFYKLAEEFGRNKWGYTILGVVTYYAGIVVFQVIVALFYELVLLESIDDLNEILLSVISIPFGLLACWGLNFYLKKQWNQKKSHSDSELLDGDLMDDNN